MYVRPYIDNHHDNDSKDGVMRKTRLKLHSNNERPDRKTKCEQTERLFIVGQSDSSSRFDKKPTEKAINDAHAGQSIWSPEFDKCSDVT